MWIRDLRVFSGVLPWVLLDSVEQRRLVVVVSVFSVGTLLVHYQYHLPNLASISIISLYRAVSKLAIPSLKRLKRWNATDMI